MSDTSHLSSKLQSLPIDILTHHLIPQFASPPVHLSQVPTPQAVPDSKPLRRLASTSKHFRSLIKSQYKTYVQHQYPTVYSHVLSHHSTNLDNINWSSLALQSEKLCHRWNHRQFYISKLSTVEASPGRQHDQHPHSRKPSHSYSPYIDVSESIDGTETLVIGQGPAIAVRTGEYGVWKEIKRKGMVPGADDVLSVHIYNPDTIISTRSSSVEIISNVSGADDGKPPRIVEVTELFPSGPKNPTGGITSSCLNPSSSSLAITASITSSDTHSLQFFNLNTTSPVPSFPKSTFFTTPLPSKPYTSTFLTNTIIATGHRSGITVHNLTPSSISDTTIPQPSTSYNHALSVHSLTRLSSSSAFSPSILASGWSDGITRLLDTRTNTYVAEYENPVSNEFVPIYSLLHTAPLGNILMAGSSLHHAVEVHDLRYTGNMVGYFSPFAFDPSSSEQGEKMSDIVSSGSLLFFDSIAGTRFPTPRRPSGYTRSSGRGTSAIYALSSPSPSSGKVYIGAENTVIQMNFRKRNVGREWGLGLSNVEKVRKKEAERGAVFNIPMYWFDPAKGAGEERGNNGRWWCGGGKAAFKVKERSEG
ncbi:uncharacterized protein DFL_003194 [Arthrobotrys flagrans]|uniref:F-box domain-containing protein n=1 Tax=Arthrobotrys flagrans TaxID=97331 RepID=A0A437A0R1_ARTFL|nr:hypothetical protein DFL_003194 [Arthrobotrys flagrans]